jgi:hypothetical protein
MPFSAQGWHGLCILQSLYQSSRFPSGHLALNALRCLQGLHLPGADIRDSGIANGISFAMCKHGAKP